MRDVRAVILRAALWSVCLLAGAACGEGQIEGDEFLEDDSVDDSTDFEEGVVDQALGGCGTSGIVRGHSVWIHFTNPERPCVPASAPHRDYSIHQELQRLIDRAPAGSQIRGNFYLISHDAIARALKRAQSRGVSVRITLDGGQAANTDPAMRWIDQLGAGGRRLCGIKDVNTSCLGTRAGAIAHTKAMTFSKTEDPKGIDREGVVWVSSANMNYSGGGADKFNNAVTVYGDRRLYEGTHKVLVDMWNQGRRADYFQSSVPRGFVDGVSANVYSSPEDDGDLMQRQLRMVDPDDRCRVRVMQNHINDTRMAVIDELVRLKRGGCKVWVVAVEIQPRAQSTLKSARIKLRHHPEVHDKSFVIYGKVDGRYRRRVWAGSHNLSNAALAKNDEAMIRLEDDEGTSLVYGAYFRHFNDAYNVGSPF